MNLKKFIKVPKDRIERIIFSAKLAENISGSKVSLEEVVRIFEEESIQLTKEQEEMVKKEFSTNE